MNDFSPEQQTALDEELAEATAELQIQAAAETAQLPAASLYNLPEEITKVIMSFTDEAQKVRELEKEIANNVNRLVLGLVEKARRQRNPTAYDLHQLSMGRAPLPERYRVAAIRRLAVIDNEELPEAINRWDIVYDALRRRTPFG